MTTIIEFFTTGTLKMSDQNVRQLLYASELLGIPSLETECFNYMKSQLTVRNSISLLILALTKKSWRKLAAFIKDFIRTHLNQVKEIGVFYTMTSVDVIQDLLHSDNLNIICEEGI